MFVKFEEYGMQRSVVVNASYVIRLSANGSEWANLFMSDGKHLIVEGSLDAVTNRLAEAGGRG